MKIQKRMPILLMENFWSKHFYYPFLLHSNYLKIIFSSNKVMLPEIDEKEQSDNSDSEYKEEERSSIDKFKSVDDILPTLDMD